ncbi:thioesterase II family protein [Streptomyces sp. V3I7]|uniref:thioesterase II family protein n=1 Tax=Streptomyces sp. V3I7 TaxID=3042278 RepID=UPI00278116C5|nr:alpha/beta fold hydrolase [Streptomyces sp. V3I7]MDQ0989109.1 surfactin synthase thioesterase subunit [Streptomyces sp. V3I7]
MTKLICLPYAGAGASVYRPWRTLSTGRLEAVPIQLPGREEEYGAPFYATIAAAAQDVATRLLGTVGDEPYAVFGHSFGSILAYEATQYLVEHGGPLPEHLVVSGSVSPRHREVRPVSADDDEQAVTDLKAMVGQDIESLNHPELRALLLPVLRADVQLLNAYEPAPRAPLPVPLTAIRGDADAMVPVPQWRDWSTFTSAAYRELEMSGGHMYLADDWALVWKTLEELL